MTKSRLRESVKVAIDDLLFEACGCGATSTDQVEELPVESIPWMLDGDDPTGNEVADQEMTQIERPEAVGLILQMIELINCPMTAQILLEAVRQIISLEDETSDSESYDEAMLSGGEQFMDDVMGGHRDEELMDSLIDSGTGCGS
jgi:hypothetical protein|tara:strand:- start:491 stop:925 length:435 start_codon:yes stop_codon:yes gene_type:complete